MVSPPETFEYDAKVNIFVVKTMRPLNQDIEIIRFSFYQKNFNKLKPPDNHLILLPKNIPILSNLSH